MNLTLRQMRYLSEVANSGSVQGASKALGISQSSIFAALAQAEADLGVRIFDRRRSKGITMTPAGKEFIAAIRRLLSAHGDFSRQVGGLSSGMPGELRLGCFEPFGAMFMTPILRKILDRVGPTSIHLFEGDQQQLLTWLMGGDVDAVITYDIGYNFENFTEICKVPTHAVLHRDDPISRSENITLHEIAERPLVLLNLPLTATFLTAIFEVKGIRPNVAFRTRNYDTVRSAVAHGFGTALLNIRPTSDISADPEQIVRIPISDEVANPRLIVADLYGDRKPTAVEMLIEELSHYFGDIEYFAQPA